MDRIPKSVLAFLSQASTVCCCTWLVGFFFVLGLGPLASCSLIIHRNIAISLNPELWSLVLAVVVNVHPGTKMGGNGDGMSIKIHGLA